MSQDIEKAKAKIKALLAQAESEAKAQTDSGTGEKLAANTAASLLYAQKAQELLLKYHLEMDDILQKEKPLDYIPPEVGVSVVFNPFHRVNARKRERMIWFEDLAKVVAKGYFCRAGVNSSYDVFFVGLDFDREVAEMVFLNLAELVHKFAPIELKKAKASVGVPSFKPTGLEMQTWCGDEVFEKSFHQGFREQIAELYNLHEKETNSIAVDDYWKNNIDRYNEDFSAVGNFGTTDKIAIEIGKRAGRVLTKKIGVAKQEDAITKQNQLVKQQKEMVKEKGGHVVLMFDTSSSMGWDSYDRETMRVTLTGREKMQKAKEGAIGYAKDAIDQKQFHVGLVKFDSDASLVSAPTDNLTQIVAGVERLYSSGGTNMVEGLNAARGALKNRHVRRVICVITDGQANDPHRTLALANDIKRQGIEIMAIGTGDADQQFLDKLVSRKGMGLLVSQNDFGSGIRKMAGLLGA